MTDDLLHLNERVHEILASESRMMGRECHLIEAAHLSADVTALVYHTDPITHGGRTQTQIRVVVYAGDKHLGSSIVRTEYPETEKQP